jgi:hypothetical protein
MLRNGSSSRGGMEGESKETCRLLVIATSELCCFEIKALLQGVSVDVTTVSDLKSLAHLAASSRFDVVVVRLVRDEFEPLSWALCRQFELGDPEYVFVVDDDSRSLGAGLRAGGLRSVGLRWVLHLEEVSAWFPRALLPLTEMARGRALVRQAEAAMPALPSGDESLSPRGLFDAERCFREAYVRTLLAASATRRQAAMLAKVPYRTFISIISKLGLVGEAQRSWVMNETPGPERLRVSGVNQEDPV